jgi:hypothetical protein
MSGKKKHYTNCNQCGIKLIEKNATYSTYDAITGAYTYRNKCNHCARKANNCLVNYEDSDLQKLAIKQKNLIQNRIWHWKVAKPKKEAAKIPYIKPTECKSCGVKLSEKNECIIKSKINNRATRCMSCVYSKTYCTYQYSIPKFEELSKIQCRIIGRSLYKKRNLEKVKQSAKNSFLKYKDKYYKNAAFKQTYLRETLNNTYVRSRILQTIPGLTYNDVTPELIEIKRKQILIKRNLKNQGIWVR